MSRYAELRGAVNDLDMGQNKSAAKAKLEAFIAEVEKGESAKRSPEEMTAAVDNTATLIMAIKEIPAEIWDKQNIMQTHLCKILKRAADLADET